MFGWLFRFVWFVCFVFFMELIDCFFAFYCLISLLVGQPQLWELPTEIYLYNQIVFCWMINCFTIRPSTDLCLFSWLFQLSRTTMPDWCKCNPSECYFQNRAGWKCLFVEIFPKMLFVWSIFLLFYLYKYCSSRAWNNVWKSREKKSLRDSFHIHIFDLRKETLFS